MQDNIENKKTTHFGYQEVAVGEKINKVAEVFHSVASKYDLMNDLMSLGVHRAWKYFTIASSGVRQGWSVLDLAGGTGDLAAGFCKKVGKNGNVVLADINFSMLQEGRKKLVDNGIASPLKYIQVDAETLPFDDNRFDCITIAFGLRNVTDKSRALRSMYRVLKPGGKLLVLEFSKPVLPILSRLYDLYSFNLLPRLGKLVTGDAASYQYLVESIRMHPNQDELLSMMEGEGYEHCRYHNLSGGVVALHIGYKF